MDKLLRISSNTSKQKLMTIFNLDKLFKGFLYGDLHLKNQIINKLSSEIGIAIVTFNF